MGRRFTTILAVEWQGVIDRSWNSESPLVFAHVVLTNTLGVRRDREIRERITRWMDLWERGLHVGLLRDEEAEGAAREVRAASGGEEEEEAVARSYHDTVMSGRLHQVVCRATNRDGVGFIFPDEQCTKTGRPVTEVLQEKHPDMRVPPCGKPCVRSIQGVKVSYQTVPLDFTEDDVTWVAPKAKETISQLNCLHSQRTYCAGEL